MFIALKMMVAIIRTLSIISGAHQFHSLKEGGVMLSVKALRAGSYKTKAEA